MTLAALPRSRLHLQFLTANDAAPDVVLYRDAALGPDVEQAFPGRGVLLGREALPGANLLRLPAVRRENRRYYASVAAELADLEVSRLIVFLEGEPLERFICGLPGIQSTELWEDGLSHYVDLTGDAWYAARGCVQAACGFHPRHITRRRIDRSRVLLRDRFEQGNLVLPAPAIPASERAELLLIGSPLVEDRIITARRMRRALEDIAAASPWLVRYLAHPREDRARAQADAGGSGLVFDPNPEGLVAHVSSHGYKAYCAAVSTGLLDLARYDRSMFVPGIFGLGRMERVLAGWRRNPVPVVGSGQALGTRLRSIA